MSRREVYGINGDDVVILDVRDMIGEYSVEELVGCGYLIRFTSPDFEECVKAAKALEIKRDIAEKYEIGGGAWRDEMNRCFWTFVRHLPGGYILCEDNGSRKLFAMYAPSYKD